MNIYALIVLSAIIVNFVIELISDVLNVRALKAQPPGELGDLYNEEVYRKSQEYTKVRTKFGWVTDCFDLALLLIFWLAGGFNRLDLLVRGFGYGEITTGLLYIGILMLLRTLLSLPFSVYSTFVIEERFGFNKTSPSTFAKDLIKGLVLAAALGGPLLACILWLFEYAGSAAWMYCWAVAAGFILLMQFAVPNWIMPLFNKFTPLDEENDLKRAITRYAESVDFSLDNVMIMDGSRRSSKANAFFTGFGKHKRIALFDTLIEKHTTAELVAILAHEIGHYKKKHVLKGMITAILHTGLMLYLLSLFVAQHGLYSAFYMERPSLYTGLVFFGLLVAPLELLMSVFLNMFSRQNEYEADRFAVETTGNKECFIQALKRLSVDNLENLTPHPFHVFLHYSHPPLPKRIGAIRSISETKSSSARRAFSR